MLLYQGKSPYSSFRKKKILSAIQTRYPDLQDLSANFLYFIQSGNLTADETTKLINIVDSTCIPWQEDKDAITTYVTPRFGTISSWSSKATDILHVSGMPQINRIERGVMYRFHFKNNEHVLEDELKIILSFLHDPMTEACFLHRQELDNLFSDQRPSQSDNIPLIQEGIKVLHTANSAHGLALSEKEITYLYESYLKLNRNPQVAELMMFAQINSEHCRHKIFNAKWTIDGKEQAHSLFAMIRNTYQCSNTGVLSAYKDNAAVLEGNLSDHFFADQGTRVYDYHVEPAHIVIKVETHNHPTAISPFEGAATGSGGEIRDEGATGIGAKPKAGLVGFSVSNLNIPGLTQPWESAIHYPAHIATALDIMLQGPIGAASFNNEFGRPNICGYFRSFEMVEMNETDSITLRGYHKPIMIAGGLGQIRPLAVKKNNLPIGAKLIVLGGPAMLIGLGGGAASSIFSGGSQEELDFASVQRSNPEMERRCQEVINACWSLGENNPIISIHDVGAGGLSNALSELVHDSDQGALFQLRDIPTADSSLNAMEIWCNEAQERYVLAINPDHLELFKKITQRERCPFAVVGEVKESQIIKLYDSLFDEFPVDLPLDILFGEASRLHKKIQTEDAPRHQPIRINLPIKELIHRVLQLPSVADKSFLITIGDRTVTGLVARDQMIGPWQVPVADVGITATSYNGYTGEAMAMGERTPIALINAKASVQMAVGEALTNILSADISSLSDIKLSANWMAATNYGHEESNLYQAVQEVGMTLCPALGICIPVGKDSLSMQMKWQTEDNKYNVAAPLSLIISAFAPVSDIRRTLTPELHNNPQTELMLIDLGQGKNRLGASALAQVTKQLGDKVPDLQDPNLLIQFFNSIKSLRENNLLLAYHDRSDGGLLATICEMMFCSHLGVNLDLNKWGDNYLASLFNEELGAVIQYDMQNKAEVLNILTQQGLAESCHVIGHVNNVNKLIINANNQEMFSASRIELHRLWSLTSYHMQSLRDNALCAKQEYDALLDAHDPGLQAKLTFSLPNTPPAIIGTAPLVAILREQGVNGHMEMAAAFNKAGFISVDVHMTDILSGEIDLQQFQGLVACGGFSYGDVLGAGRGWANSILYNEIAREQFSRFFNLPSVFVLGVCNGCQMFSNLKDLIPGAAHWPRFVRNTSDQFEARLSLVKVRRSPSIFFQGMEDSIIPIAVSHGEGRVEFDNPDDSAQVLTNNLVPLQYVNHYGDVTTDYPVNPNGSVAGITALTTKDGRFTIMMPHAERVFRTSQFSWHPKEWPQENSPWLQLFLNARNWLM